MSEFSFEVDQQALDVVRRTSIDANFAECKAALTEMMAPYASMIVSEDSLPQAKADRARIRKVASRIDEARKAVKRAYTDPLAVFEQKCKELTAICGEADANIDSQVKAFDQKRKDEKIAELRSFFNANVGEADDFIHFEAIYNKRWENVTYSVEAAHADIMREITSCISSVNAIRTLRSPFETTLLDLYRHNHDLAACMEKNDHLLRLREMEEQRRAEREAAERAAKEKEAAKKAAQEQRSAETELPQQHFASDGDFSSITEPGIYHVDVAENAPFQVMDRVRVLDFRVFVTAQQMTALKVFLQRNGIRFCPVPKDD